MFSSPNTKGTGISKAVAEDPTLIKNLIARCEGITSEKVIFRSAQGRGSGRFITPSTTFIVRCRAIGPKESESISVQVRTVQFQPALLAPTKYRSIVFIWRNRQGNSTSAVAFPGSRFQALLDDPDFRLNEKSGKYHFNVSSGWKEECQNREIPFVTTQTVTSW